MTVPFFAWQLSASRLRFAPCIEAPTDVYAALNREKQIKRWQCQKKVALVKRTNPEWRDFGRVLAIAP